MALKTGITPNGTFIYGIHKPHYSVRNLRKETSAQTIGSFPSGTAHTNQINFPTENILQIEAADWVYEIPNAFPFKGVTYINKKWADRKASNPDEIELPKPISGTLKPFFDSLPLEQMSEKETENIYKKLPKPILLAVAISSDVPKELEILAKLSVEIEFNTKQRPVGLKYKSHAKHPRAIIKDEALFEAVVNNPFLADDFKKAMVLVPGSQGESEIVGDATPTEDDKVYEYLRRNSYIPWGHFAANMSDLSIRYSTKDLSFNDMESLRHLYYQRSFVGIAEQLNLKIDFDQKGYSAAELDSIRIKINEEIANFTPSKIKSRSTLWGWNFGFDYAPTGYRLHASHQQIHQQYAMIPNEIEAWQSNGQKSSRDLPCYSLGDLVGDFIDLYEADTKHPFFEDYLKAIKNNRRMDDPKTFGSLIVFEDENIILFVPKGQTSQWELQVMTKKAVGNILEADIETRSSLDMGIWIAQKILNKLGARLVTSIEYSKRFGAINHQHLIYALLPRMPDSPGSFTEAQLRWINGHYPEDFALRCRTVLEILGLTI